MRVTREQARENRNRVLLLAAQRFREKGLKGPGVAELMQDAGLTHGGFYKQFPSKEQLAAEACASAMADNLAAYEGLARQHPQDFPAIAAAMVSEHHRNSPGDGCVLASLGAEIARSDDSVRAKVTEGVRKIVHCLSGLMPGRSKKEARRRALAAYATVVGSLVVSRAVDDPAFAREILKAAREELAARHKHT